MNIKPSGFDSRFAQDAVYTLLFGLLSAMLGLIRFQIPGFEGYSDLREIPLLISLFYIKNPLFIFGLSLLTLIGIVVPPVPVFISHFASLWVGWFLYRVIRKRNLSNLALGLSWFLITLIYYFLFLIPLLILTHKSNASKIENIIDLYVSIDLSGKFEIVTTAIVSSLFLMRSEVIKSLEDTNQHLEEMVRSRTEELSNANEELKALNQELVSSNEEVEALNENLKSLVEERTQKINQHPTKLIEYSRMNSHEVRAPLARMLGLIDLLKREVGEQERKYLTDRLYTASEELDNVIRRMNRLLENDEQ